jgi:hypothetical protein
MSMLNNFLILQIVFLGILSLVLTIRVFRKKITFKKALLILGLCFLFVVLILYPYRSRIKEQILRYRNIFIHNVVKTNSCSCDHMPLPKDDYAFAHRVQAIRTTKNAFILNDAFLQKQKQQGQLISVQEGEGFYMTCAPNSYRYLTPLANKRLIELGKLFRAEISNQSNIKDYFVITSMTRTEAQQEVIRKKYPGQATKGSSTHSFGVSFDISEIKTKGECKVGYAALLSALKRMQQEGKILLCPESTCMHVTVVR